MTNLQISRNNWLEAKRHNSATEVEANRHNAEMERLQSEANAETARAHRESESISRDTLAESIRHSMAGESISTAANAETQRSNLAREAETFRNNYQQHADNRALARMTNSREWAKINLNEQRTLVQNDLDKAKTQAQKLANWIDKHKADLGYYDLEVDKLRADVDSTLQNIELAYKYYNLKKTVDLRNLTYEERKTASQEALNAAKASEIEWKKLETIFSTIDKAVSSGSKIGSLIGKAASLLG